MPVKPINMEKERKQPRIYEAIIVAAKRARQIHNDIRLELNQRLETLQQLTQTVDPDDEMDVSANPDQLKISLEFETRPKPTEMSLQELLAGNLKWRKREEEKPEVKPPEEEPEAKE